MADQKGVPPAPPGSGPVAGAAGSPQMPPPPDPDAVSITVDGRPMRARKGEMIIAAAERGGTYIPRFCYHPRMAPVGNCRMCLVEVKGPRGFSLMPACFNPVADGQEIVTTSEKVKKAQDGVLEFLLINHPLDCPVCDKGGECPLQDQTLAYGPGESRFVEEKRHWDKPISISPLVDLDRERCIQCSRCTRFADEVAGDPLIDFAERADHIEVATFPDAPFNSYFSGNVVQICPVGALTSTPYRFRARPWDLEQVESSCTSCAVGCRVAVQSSADEITRLLGIDTDPVNWSWLCDKGRFDYEAITSPERVTVPFLRKGDELVESSWGEALAAAAEGLRLAGQLGVIGGSRLPNEDAYAWAKTARVALGTDNVDCQLGDGLPAEMLLGLPRATIDQAASARLVLTLAPDIKEELPVLYLRLRHAAVNDNVPIVELTPKPTGLSRYAASTLTYRPGDVAAVARALAGTAPVESDVGGVPAEAIRRAWTSISRALHQGSPGQPSVVVVLGRPTVSEHADAVAEAAGVLAGLPGVAFLPALRRSNVHGALDMGLAPGVLPGRVGLDAGRDWYTRHWGRPLPSRAGLDTSGMLAAAAAGRLGGLVLVGADPLSDYPDADLARRGVAGARFVVSVDCFLNPSSRRADVILPPSMYAERRGSFTNLEGRITWLAQKVTPPGAAWPDWMIAGELAARLGHDFGFDGLDDIWDEIEVVSPLHAGVSHALITSRQGRNGVVVPPGLEPERVEEARPLDPMADPGIGTAESHMIPPTSLLGAGAGRHPAPGAGAHAPEGEAEGRRNAPSDTDVDVRGGAQPSELGLMSAPAVPEPAEREGGPQWSPPPPRLELRPRATSTQPPPAPESGMLRLVATRRLWDGGTLVANCRSLTGLRADATVALHPGELERRGLAAGQPVRVSSRRGTVVVSAVADRGVPEGCAAVAVNLPAGSATTLIDEATGVTDVRVEAEGEP
jgi:NADH-quinone oxidoreductase subunit G